MVGKGRRLKQIEFHVLVCRAGSVADLAQYQSVAIPVLRETQSLGNQNEASKNYSCKLEGFGG